MLMQWVKQNLTTKKFYNKGDEIGKINVAGGVIDKSKIIVAEEVSALVTHSENHKLELKIDLPSSIYAPIQAGKMMIITEHDTQEIDLLTKESVPKPDFSRE